MSSSIEELKKIRTTEELRVRLQQLKRPKLQSLAKHYGIKANLPTMELLGALFEIISGKSNEMYGFGAISTPDNPIFNPKYAPTPVEESGQRGQQDGDASPLLAWMITKNSELKRLENELRTITPYRSTGKRRIKNAGYRNGKSASRLAPRKQESMSRALKPKATSMKKPYNKVTTPAAGGTQKTPGIGKQRVSKSLLSRFATPQQQKQNDAKQHTSTRERLQEQGETAVKSTSKTAFNSSASVTQGNRVLRAGNRESKGGNRMTRAEKAHDQFVKRMLAARKKSAKNNQK